MLFNSYPFLVAFFPLTLVAFFVIGRFSHALAAAWLASRRFAFMPTGASPQSPCWSDRSASITGSGWP